ncbi:leucine-rich repeat-containing protein 24-like [Macrobrachium nipponense]|uniref:leucine-rich repeat-containing protein 24-like n=1 Tax=Macrobrachium nipponense TaxID=159736 RepID=UPI0030C7E1F7
MSPTGTFRTLAFLLAIAVLAVSASDCPTFCSCKWKQGKQTAECVNKQLMTLPPNLDPATQALDISLNKIQRLPSRSFAQEGLINLQKIFLQNNNLHEIDIEAFISLTNLVMLDLSKNELKQIPVYAFQHTPALMELYLSGNSLQHIDSDAFKYLESLKTLDISDCHISKIDASAFEPLTKLEKLKLHGNRLTELKPRLVESLQNLHAVTVHDNPWTCDCRLRKLREWLVEKRVPHVESPACATPLRIKDERFSDLKEEEFACPPEILPTRRTVDSAEGENATLWCPVGGLPTPRVSWYVRELPVSNGSLISEGGAHGFILDEASEERGSLLFITDAKVQDSGLAVKCTATNAAGSASATFELSIAPGSSGFAGLSIDKIAAIAAVLVVVLVILIGVFIIVVRRRNSHTPVPIKTVSVNGATETRIADLPYTPSAFVGGSVIATSDNPDLLCEADYNSDEEVGGICTADEGSEHSVCSGTPRLASQDRSHAVSLDSDDHKTSLGRCPFETMWEPERVHAVLDSAAPEHVMHRSLHEPLTPTCDALVQQRLQSSSQRHLNHRLSYLPDFAPDYSELYSFSQIGPGQTYTSVSGVPVPHYGTIPRSMKMRSSAPEIIPGDGTPTMTRHPRAWHFGSEGTPLIAQEQRRSSGTPMLSAPAPAPTPTTTSATTYLPTQPLQSHSSKLSRITARDSPDEGYQEGADV